MYMRQVAQTDDIYCLLDDLNGELDGLRVQRAHGAWSIRIFSELSKLRPLESYFKVPERLTEWHELQAEVLRDQLHQHINLFLSVYGNRV